MNYIQAFINNISAPKTLEELLFFIEEHGQFNVEDIIYDAVTDLSTVWTVPFWAKIGDIVFFMHAKTARTHLTALRTKLNKEQALFTKKQFKKMYDWIERGIELHTEYGGKIIAVGRVSGVPEYYYEDSSVYHWRSRIYSEIDELFVLDNPIDISEFNHQIMVSRQSGITPVFGDDFVLLKDLIGKKNTLPQFFKESFSTPVPLSKIDDKNWITLTKEYRRAFMLESQFRTFYVNYLLKEISDIKTIYKECRCKKEKNPDSFVDNIILFQRKYLPVEVKLSISSEKNIYNQLNKYCYTDEIIIDSKTDRKVSGKKLVQNKVLLIDTDTIYIYNADKNTITKIYDLDLLQNKKDIKNLIDNLNNLI